ncbi:hypothetical protein NLU13_2353 [Sarocladium strictum]|uniref:MFS maltose permease n=1 Tax=Sarocladium strictum TaxID=5046 RepID=A0AA39GUM0_SARSR|nr:hypothetical protein NLU13_2353 [Sarocladium strictum]
MRPRLVVRRLWLPQPRINHRLSLLRAFTSHAQLTNTSSRPNLPFLNTPSTSAGSRRIRNFTSDRKRWLRRELKNGVKYTLVLWVAAGCVLMIFFAISEETTEREHPTPHEWGFFTRKALRDCHQRSDPRNGQRKWGDAVQLGAEVQRRLEDPSKDGQGVVKLEGYDVEDPDMVPCDITAKSEEWRRGYFDALMATAKAAEHTEGWLLDTTRDLNIPPEYVIGPSNPRPKPLPKGAPPAPREEDCVIAFPSAAEYYLKISRTKGLTPKQQLDARLEEAAYWEYMGRPDTAQECLAHCLVLANGDANASAVEEWIRVDQMAPVRRTSGDAPSSNMLDVMTSLANLWARNGNLPHALTTYLSVLHARRSLPTSPPVTSRDALPRRVPAYQQVINFFAPPPYPPPPPSGFSTPWRSPEERCQEAALQLHIGEILFATSSKEEGLAWTRDGVDAAEEQLRAIGPSDPTREQAERATCRECLNMGLMNWTTMVSRMAAQEKQKLAEKEASGGGGSSSWGLAFWRGGNGEGEGRWTAEEKVVAERVRRTKELVDDVAAPKENYLVSLFKV